MIAMDDYVIDVLMRDLVGHDRAPSALSCVPPSVERIGEPPEERDSGQPSDDRQKPQAFQGAGAKRQIRLSGAEKVDQGPEGLAHSDPGISCLVPVAPLSIATLHYNGGRRSRCDTHMK